MSDESLEIVRGSGNLFRDFRTDDADLRQLKALLAAEIIERLDQDGLSVRRAQALTGVPAADFSRIRTADLDRFTADRLIGILNRLGARVDVALTVRPTTARRARAV